MRQLKRIRKKQSEEKTGKDCKPKKHKKSPNPNIDAGSGLGSCFLFSFCKKRVFLKRRKYDGSCWNLPRPVF